MDRGELEHKYGQERAKAAIGPEEGYGGVYAWKSEDGRRYTSTPISPDDYYRRVEWVEDDVYAMAWRRAVLFREPDGEISVDRRMVSGRHELILGVAAAVVGAAGAAGVHAIRKHHNKD